jgi:hypothetical protein
MSLEANKGGVYRFYREVLNGRNLEVLDELAVPDYDEHSPFPGQPHGIEGLKARVGGILAAFPPSSRCMRSLPRVTRWSPTGQTPGHTKRSSWASRQPGGR